MMNIEIHQTLHGYSEGHRLLDGSIRLSDDVSRLLLRMSDLSGSSIVAGFEDYLTGYPLEEAELYAFAKTWYAPEMPRPGCVWTHTLLIPIKHLRKISCLGTMESLFIRPKEEKVGRGYSKTITVDSTELDDEITPPPDLRNQLTRMFTALYALDKQNILIAAQNSKSYQSAILHLWSQQWPQLRKAFSFCTGALSGRGVAGKPFTVQCTHPSLIREITAATITKQSREVYSLPKNESHSASWIDRAVEDALCSSGGEFRQMLWEFGNEATLADYSRFAQIIDKYLASPDEDVDALIQIVADAFPESNSAIEVKTSLFGKPKLTNKTPRFDEGVLLAALASTQYHLAFDSNQLQLRARGHDLCENQPESARSTISKLFRTPVNPLGEEILAGMITAITPEIAREVTSERPEFLPALFRAKPELGASCELWLAAGDRKRELFESLVTHEKLGEALVKEIVGAILQSGAEYLLRRALDRWKTLAVFGSLDWVAKCNGILSSDSIGALTFYVDNVAEWVLTSDNHPENAIVAAAHIIAPYSHQIKHLNSDIWLRTFHSLSRNGQKREASYFAAFLLALGFQNAAPAPMILIGETFEHLHQLAWDNVMPEDIWMILDPVVPHLWWFYDWDKCERLRKGLIEAFVRHNWSRSALIDCIKSERLLGLICESAERVHGGNIFASLRY